MEPTIVASDGTVRRGRAIPAGQGSSFAVGIPDLVEVAANFQARLRFEASRS